MTRKPSFCATPAASFAESFPFGLCAFTAAGGAMNLLQEPCYRSNQRNQSNSALHKVLLVCPLMGRQLSSRMPLKAASFAGAPLAVTTTSSLRPAACDLQNFYLTFQWRQVSAACSLMAFVRFPAARLPIITQHTTLYPALSHGRSVAMHGQQGQRDSQVWRCIFCMQ